MNAEDPDPVLDMSGSLFSYNSGLFGGPYTYVNTANAVNSAGPQGSIGSVGASGATGATGPTGYFGTNITYNNGTAGVSGTQGYYSGNLGIGTTGNNYYTWTGTPSYQTMPFHVQGDAEIVGNLKVKGVDICELMEKIQDRLAILTTPSPEKLEKFEALKKAYENYKLLEKLVGEE